MNPAEAADTIAELVEHLLAHADAIACGNDALDDLIDALDLAQTMCWSSVELANVPEPVRMDGMRKALAASVIERLTEVYSAAPHHLPQRSPAWCENVPASPVEIWLIDKVWGDADGLNKIFAKRNIYALENFLAFV